MANRKDGSSSRLHFRIDDLQVQPERNLIVRNGHKIQLERRMMQVLTYLAEHAGETVGTGTLLVELWGSEVYGDNPVNKTVSLLRKLIGDDARNPRYIETINKVGYRMIATVSMPEDYRRLPTELWTDGSPYVGLSAFDARHAPVYCGRSRIVADLLEAMRKQIENQRRFVMIVGASGCGKTSLLRAGAIPLLTKPDGYEGLRTLSIAACDLAAAPAHDPLTPLIEAIARWTIDEGGTDGDRPVFPPQTTEQLKSLLTGHPENIEHFVAEAFRRHPEKGLAEQPHAHLLLTIDHAETLVASDEIDAKIRETFEHLLLALCDCPHVLVTMIARSDFYPKLTETLPALTERKAGDGHLDVLSPRYGEIGEIIRTPAWRANLSFEIDPDSRDRLDDVLRDAAVAQPDALPLLQHTLENLYAHRSNNGTLTFSAYNDIGGLEGAIAHRAEEVFCGFPRLGQVDPELTLECIFSSMVMIQSDSGVVSACPIVRSQLDHKANQMVQAFIDAHLFVSDLDGGEPIVKVAHEALLRQWPRASAWIEENRRLLQAKGRLERAANMWMEQGRSADHLLNPGRPLGEAREVAQRFNKNINHETCDYLKNSEKSYKRKKIIHNMVNAALFILTLISTSSYILAFRAKNEAEKREHESRRLTEYLLGPLAEELRNRGMLEILGEVGTEAIEYLGDRNIQSLNSSELSNTARAYRTVGEALLQIDSPEKAMTSFRQSHKLANLALQKDSTNEDAIFERGNASFWIGQIDYIEKKYESAKIHWDNYHRDSMLLISISPKNPRSQLELSYAENLIGTIALRQGDAKKAIAHFKKSASRKKYLVDSFPERLDYIYEYIDSISWITTALEMSGQLSEASSEYDHQISTLNSLIKKKKNSNKWRHRLANYMMLSATLEAGLNNLEKAISNATEAVKILEALVAMSPETDEWSRDLAKARLILAESSNLRSDQKTALIQLNYILKYISKLDTNSRNSTPWRSIEARTTLYLSIIGKESSQSRQAEKAVSELAILARANESEELIENYAHGLLILGMYHARHSNNEIARSKFIDAISEIEKTNWKNNPFRSWIWSNAKKMTGRSIDAKDQIIWLSSIGYKRPVAMTAE